MSEKKIEASDVDQLYKLVSEQFKEDREFAVEAYKKLKEYIDKDPQLFLESGDTLAKYGELLIKQTAQVVDLIKLSSKQQVDEGDLTEGDLSAIQNEIDSEEVK